MVQLEHLQRGRQRRDLADVVAVEVQCPQEGQALPWQQGWADKKKGKKSVILRLGDAEARVPITAVRNIQRTGGFQMCASRPCHLSCGIFSLSLRLPADIKCSRGTWPPAQPIRHFSVITGMRGGKKSDSKNKFFLYSFSPKPLAAAVFQPAGRHSVDWSERSSGGGGVLGAVGFCVG